MEVLYSEILHQCTGFDWDKGNINKNRMKHNVTSSECEQIFFNQPLLIQNAVLHSKTEKRFCALGKTDRNRRLFIAFTVRNDLIRVISARDMSRKERRIYESAEKNT
jgi:hypothetical protein